MESKNTRLLWLEVIASISQILSFIFQVLTTKEISLSSWVILLPTAIGVLAASAIILQPSKISQPQNEKSQQLAKLTQNAKAILIFIIFTFIVFLLFQSYKLIPQDNLTVLIVNFSEKGNPNSTDQTTSLLIFDELQKSIGDEQDINVIFTQEALISLNSEDAIKLGRRYKATIVIWGWYTLRQNDVLITPHLEILTDYPTTLPFQLNQKIIPRSSFESFNLEFNLSGEYSYLSSTIIGTIRYSQNRYEDAIRIYSRIIEENKGSENISLIYNMRGLSYNNSGQYLAAKNDYLKAIELNPKKPVYYYNLGSIQTEINETDDAVFSFEKAINVDPYFSPPLNSLGVIYHDAGNLALAEIFYLKAIQLTPYEATYRLNLSELYLNKDSYVNALTQINEALKYESTNWQLRSQKANIYFAQQKYGAGILESILALYYLQPAQTITLLIITISFLLITILDRKQKGKISGWISAQIFFGVSFFILTTLGFKKPNQTKSHNNIIKKILLFGILLRYKAYLILDNKTQANSFLEASIARGIQNTELLTMLGILYFDQQKHDLAAKVFTDILKVDKQNEHAHFGLGWIYAEENKLSLAIINFQKATISPIYELNAWLLAGDLHWKQRDVRGALVSWKKAVQKDAQYVADNTLLRLSNPSLILSPVEHFKLGLAHYHLGNKKNAITGFEIALKQGSYTALYPHAKLQLQRAKLNASK